MTVYIHAGFMVCGFTFMATGMVIARYFKKKKWWLKAHRILGILGALQVWVGFAAAVLMVARAGGEHFDVFHAYLGLAVILLATATSVMGQRTLHKPAPGLRNVHRWSGRATLVLWLVNAALGIALVL